MDSQPGTIWGREPAMVLALVQAVIALVVAFASTSHPTRLARSLAVTAVILGSAPQPGDPAEPHPVRDGYHAGLASRTTFVAPG